MARYYSFLIGPWPGRRHSFCVCVGSEDYLRPDRPGEERVDTATRRRRDGDETETRADADARRARWLYSVLMWVNRNACVKDWRVQERGREREEEEEEERDTKRHIIYLVNELYYYTKILFKINKKYIFSEGEQFPLSFCADPLPINCLSYFPYHKREKVSMPSASFLFGGMKLFRPRRPLHSYGMVAREGGGHSTVGIFPI